MKRNNLILGIFGTVSIFFAFQNIVHADGEAITIHLDVETATSTLFDADVNVSPCSALIGSASSTSGYCAIQASGVASSWSSYGDDYFLDSLGGVGNDFTNNVYWGWFSDLDYGMTALNKHTLSEGERFIVTLGKNPLKVTVSTTTPAVGATTTVSVLEFGFDDSWNGVWRPSASSSIVLDGVQNFTENGTYDFVATSTGVLNVFAIKDGFIQSPTSVISPVGQFSSAPISTNNNTLRSADQSPAPKVHHTLDVPSALRFLESKQASDGSFGSSVYTDWAAIACASASESLCADKVMSYFKSSSFAGTRVTDYERRAMALMSLGIDPYTGTGINYIQKISDSFDGTQIGEPGLVNDDIFSIFPLIKAGYSPTDQMIKTIVSFIMSKQNSNGSWEGSVDLTSAAVQALSLVSSLDGVNSAKSSARAYLASHENPDGGFGSSFSTSWVLQAVMSLGENPQSWQVGDNNLQDYLYSAQQSDGGVEHANADQGTRVWATAYAIPAALGKTWTDLLHSFSRQTIMSPSNQVQNIALSVASTTATSTKLTVVKAIASSTPALMVVKPKAIEVVTKLTVVAQASTKTPVATSSLQAMSSNVAAAASLDSIVPKSVKEAIKGFVRWFWGLITNL